MRDLSVTQRLRLAVGIANKWQDMAHRLIGIDPTEFQEQSNQRKRDSICKRLISSEFHYPLNEDQCNSLVVVWISAKNGYRKADFASVLRENGLQKEVSYLNGFVKLLPGDGEVLDLVVGSTYWEIPRIRNADRVFQVRECAKCALSHEEKDIYHQVSIPCGHLFHRCKKCVESTVQKCPDCFANTDGIYRVFDNPGDNNLDGQESDCVVCMDGKVSRVFIPCGHLCICETCALDSRNTRTCPICRSASHTVSSVTYGVDITNRK